jgi:hypothetical protein
VLIRRHAVGPLTGARTPTLDWASGRRRRRDVAMSLAEGTSDTRAERLGMLCTARHPNEDASNDRSPVVAVLAAWCGNVGASVYRSPPATVWPS